MLFVCAQEVECTRSRHAGGAISCGKAFIDFDVCVSPREAVPRESVRVVVLLCVRRVDSQQQRLSGAPVLPPVGRGFSNHGGCLLFLVLCASGLARGHPIDGNMYIVRNANSRSITRRREDNY